VSRARDSWCVRSAVCAGTRAMKRGGSANSSYKCSHRALSGSPRSVRSRLARRRAHRFVFSLGFRSPMPLIFRHHIRRHRRTSGLGTTSADLPAPFPISGAWTVGACTRSPQSAWTRHRLQEARNGASDSEHKRLLWLDGYWRVSDTDVYFLLLLTALRSGGTVGIGCKTSRSKDRSPTPCSCLLGLFTFRLTG